MTELLFTDLDLAFTFLETARISRSAETQERNVRHATKAYWDVFAKALEIEMPDRTREQLQARLRDLEAQIANFRGIE